MATVSSSLKMFQDSISSLEKFRDALMAAAAMAELFRRMVQAEAIMRAATGRMDKGGHAPKAQEVSARPIIIDIEAEPIRESKKRTEARSAPVASSSSLLPVPVTPSMTTQLVPNTQLVPFHVRLQSPSQGMNKTTSDLKKHLTQFMGKLAGMTNDSITNIKNMGGKLSAAVGKYMTMGNVKKLLSSTVGGAMKQQEMRDTLSIRFGDRQVGNGMYDQVAKQALHTGQSTDGMLSSTMGFMSKTLDPKQLEQLNELSVRLSKLNPKEGLAGAAGAVKQMMSGDSAAVAEKFSIRKSDLEGSAAMKAGKAGNIDGFIQGMDELLNKQNMTKQALEQIIASPAAQWQKAIASLRFILAQAGHLAMNAFGPFITRFNALLDSGKLTPFFMALSGGLYAAVSAATMLAQGFLWVVQIVGAHLPEITAMLLMWIATYLPVLAVQLWALIPPLLAMVSTLTQVAIRWLIINWPVLLVVGIVGLLIFAIRKMGVTTDQMIGTVVGAFYGWLAAMQNIFGYFWNVIVSWAEFFANVWKNPVYAVKKLFYDLVNNVAGFIDSMINGVIDGVNFLIKAYNKLPKVAEIPVIPDLNLKDWAEELKPFTDEKVVDLSSYKMEFKDISQEAQNGYKKGAGMIDSMDGIFKGFDLSGFKPPAIPQDMSSISKVGEVGKINSTVDISNEDLKMMRELAEMKNIQNFVSLTPTVQVSTGPVNKESDIETIVSRIEQVLTEQIASSAEGVYA